MGLDMLLKLLLLNLDIVDDGIVALNGCLQLSFLSLSSTALVHVAATCSVKDPSALLTRLTF